MIDTNLWQEFVILYGNSSQDYSELVQNIFKSHFGLGYRLKSPYLGPKTEFPFFDIPHFSVFDQNSFFRSQISRSNL